MSCNEKEQEKENETAIHERSEISFVVENEEAEVDLCIPNITRKRKLKESLPTKNVKGSYNNIELFEILQTFFERSGKQIKCNVVDCNSSISRWQLYYMKRHFEHCHPSKLSELFPDIINDVKKIDIEMCELMHNVVELVTVNGVPFSILDTSAMKGRFQHKLYYFCS